jgi:arylformamidase
LRLVDLTHGFTEGMPSFDAPWYPRCKVERTMTPQTDPAGAGRTFSHLHLFPHNATHVDAPRHFFPNGAEVEDLGLDPFIGPAVVADLTAVPLRGAIDAGDLQQALADRLRRGDRVLLRTDHLDRHWGRPDFWHTSPYLTGGAATWLVEQGVRLVGVDFNPEITPTREFPVHRTLLGAGIPLLEYICNLRQVRGDRCYLLALPTRVVGVEATPVRTLVIEGVDSLDLQMPG